MKWAFSTETAKNKTKKTTCLESLNIFGSKMIKGLSIVLFPSAKSNCGFIGLHGWGMEVMLHKTHQKLYSEGEERRASSATPSFLILSSKFENSIAVHRKGIREQGRGRPSFTPPV